MDCNFRYSDLPADYFRLLQLSGIDGDLLECQLTDVPIDSTPEYDAISYSWNNEQTSTPIICNEKRLLITLSLHSALRTFCSLNQRRPVWADAICINQSNDEEKAGQVPLMGKYYSEARSVLIWLGPSGTHTDLVLDRIEVLNKSLQAIENPLLVTNETLRSHGLPDRDSPIWQGIGESFARHWFRRLWIVQEVALASHIVVFCGSKSTGWHQLSHLADHIERAGLIMLVRGDVDADMSKSDGFDAMMVPNFIRDSRSRGMHYPLSTLCHFARSRDTSEPVDKVYAVLGLTDETVRKKIEVDYSQQSRRNYWKAYVNLGHVLLEGDPTFFLLQIASSKQRPSQLPSWCPNFNSTSEALLLPRGFYSAGMLRDAAAGHEQKSYLGVASDHNGIRLRGVLIDEVDEVVPSLWRWHTNPVLQEGPNGCAARCFEWMNECRALSRSVFQTPNALPEQLVRTFIANILHHPVTYDPGREELQQFVRDATIYLQALRDVRTLPSDRLTQSGSLRAQRYLNAMNMVCTGRRFFSAKGGSIGIGPLQTLPGDLVYVLRGAQAPFLFRQELVADCFTLVGEAYVHGSMNGEVFNQRQRDVSPERILTVI